MGRGSDGEVKYENETNKARARTWTPQSAPMPFWAELAHAGLYSNDHGPGYIGTAGIRIQSSALSARPVGACIGRRDRLHRGATMAASALSSAGSPPPQPPDQPVPTSVPALARQVHSCHRSSSWPRVQPSRAAPIRPCQPRVHRLASSMGARATVRMSIAFPVLSAGYARGVRG